MALTPAATDPKRDEELKRRNREPESFGIGGGRSQAIAAKREEEAKASEAAKAKAADETAEKAGIAPPPPASK